MKQFFNILPTLIQALSIYPSWSWTFSVRPWRTASNFCWNWGTGTWTWTRPSPRLSLSEPCCTPESTPSVAIVKMRYLKLFNYFLLFNYIPNLFTNASLLSKNISLQTRKFKQDNKRMGSQKDRKRIEKGIEKV